MRKLNALAASTKNHGVLTNHIAFANRLNRNFVLNLLRRFQNVTERFGRPAGRIFFHLVMRFDNLCIKIAPEQFASLTGQPEEHINSDAEIRRKHNRQRLRGLFNKAPLLFRMSRGADDE